MSDTRFSFDLVDVYIRSTEGVPSLPLDEGVDTITYSTDLVEMLDIIEDEWTLINETNEKVTLTMDDNKKWSGSNGQSRVLDYKLSLTFSTTLSDEVKSLCDLLKGSNVDILIFNSNQDEFAVIYNIPFMSFIKLESGTETSGFSFTFEKTKASFQRVLRLFKMED